MKKLVLRIRDFIVAYSKYIFPVLLIAVVAVTVSIALGAREEKDSMVNAFETDVATESENETGTDETNESSMTETAVQEVTYAPLEYNAYPEVWTLICTYYNALGTGDAETVEKICSDIEEMGKIKIREQSKYIESYPVVEVYTKPGPVEGSYIVFAYTKAKFRGFEEEVAGVQTLYVCTDEDGNLYLNEGEMSQEELAYIDEVIQQDDVQELLNKTSVEYSDALVANPSLLEFVAQMENDIRINMGLIIAELENGSTGQQGGDVSQSGGEQTGSEQTEESGQAGENNETGELDPNAGQQGGETTQPGGEQQGETPTPVTQETIYVKATTTVNVRASASTKADRIGSLAKGLQVKLLEEQANGWSKVEYEGKEGYIKSDYLEKITVVTEVTQPQEENKVIGKVTATTTVRIRELPSTDSAKLGALVEGAQLELLAVENGWCKVLYNGKVAYVSEKYVNKKLN